MMFLLYNPTGSGHYDAIIPYICTVKDSKASSKPNKEHKSCRCGVNGNNSGKSCTPNQSYATRCKCYLSSTPCSSHCHCKNCNNPCGQKPVTSFEVKRKRRAHSLQTELASSKKFAVERGEVLPVNIWSTFETLVLSELQNIKETEDLDTFQLYNEIVKSHLKQNFSFNNLHYNYKDNVTRTALLIIRIFKAGASLVS